MAVSTHVPNSTVPDCRMRVPRRRNTSTAQSWRCVPDAILPGHRRVHWWVAHTVGRPWVARPHTRAHGTGARNKHAMSPKQIHEVTNRDSVIRADGSGSCGHTAKQVWSMDSRAESVDVKDIESPRNRDTANEEPSTVTEYLSRPSSTTLATHSIVHNHGRETVGWNAGFHGWKAQNQWKHDARDADVLLIHSGRHR